MKLFWRDQTPVLLVYAGQLILIIVIFWLAGNRNPWIAAYALLLGTCLLALYLLYRYFSMKTMYVRLSGRLCSLDESIEEIGHAPLPAAVEGLLRVQYEHYHEQLDQYEGKLRDHVTFINQWVHQMKTPLSVIHLTIQEEDDPIFNSIREETDRLRKGLETILYTSRLDSFEHDFHVEPVRLRQVGSQVIADHKSSFIRNHVYPEVLIPEDLWIYSDEKWLTFLIGQLVSNAIRYSAGSQEKVTLAAEVRGSKVVLEVRDRGVGIPSQDVRRVFEPYFTGENGRKFRESTGMGLYLVREIGRHLGHRVELESEVGAGTMVRLTLQVARPPLHGL